MTEVSQAADAAQATLSAMRAGSDVIYQGTLRHGPWLGRPDFLLKVARPCPALGAHSYEVADAKLARETKARALLQFSPRTAAQDIRKLIESAASNAENNHDSVADEMRIAEITVDEGPTLKRFRPRARGSASPILKRTSHIAVVLSPEQDRN